MDETWKNNGNLVDRDYIVHQADISFVYVQKALKAEDPERRLHFLKLAALTHPGGTGCRGEMVTIADYDEGREAADRFPAPDYPDLLLESGQAIVKLGYDYVRLPGAAVTVRGHVVHRGRLISDIVQAESPFWREGDVHYWFFVERPFAGFDPGTRRAFLSVPDVRRTRQAFVFPTANAAVNFGHFLHDVLLKIPVFRRLQVQYGEITCLFAQRFRYPMQWLLFEEIFKSEIARGLIVFGDIAGTYDDVFVAFSQFSPLDGINYDAARELRVILQDVAHRRKSGTAYAPMLYVSRRDGVSTAYGRAEADEEEECLFEGLGFEVLIISKMAPEDVFAAFQSADVVAGTHGAGLLNALFSANSRCRVIEIQPPNSCWNSIERLAKAAGLQHASVRYRPSREQMLLVLNSSLRK